MATKRRKNPYNKRSARQTATLEKLQTRYPFKRPLSYYLMGAAGNPEEQEQKALINCLCAEFGELIGRYVVQRKVIDKKSGVALIEDVDIYPALVVATADFYDKRGTQMTTFRHMGYQPGTPDIMILARRGEYAGLIIEMKSQRGSASPGQKKTLAFLRTQGFSCHVCKGYAAALEVWLDYLGA